MKLFAFVSLLFSTCTAFKVVQQRSTIKPQHAVVNKPFNPELLQKAGVFAPMGYFDPLGLSKVDEPTLKKYRESEIKHGRVAMLAVLGMLVAEVYHPIDSRILGASIYHFHEAQLLQVVGGLIPSCIIIFLLEIKSITESWEFDDDTRTLKRVANLLDEYTPGDLGFDPLGLCPSDEDAFIEMRTKELSNGRLAMLAVVGMIVQELVDGKGIYEHFIDAGGWAHPLAGFTTGFEGFKGIPSSIGYFPSWFPYWFGYGK